MKRSLFAFALVACSGGAPPPPAPVQPAPVQPAVAAGPRTITIIGTNDLHGSLDRLPLLGGFIANVRAARAADGGGVLLLDGGDLFQGTIESNMAEGADVVLAYNALHYNASAVGNHEFDYGPVGRAATAKSPDDDPRGALKKNLADAQFPFLAANIIDEATGAVPAWPNLKPSTTVGVAGIKVGIIGVSTKDTPTTTMPANFVGLHMADPVGAITQQAQQLRAAGADVIVVVAHLGDACRDVTNPDDTASCDHKGELFPVADALPKGLVDVIVAGHTHAAIAHRVDGIAVIESYSSGRGFGRVDLTVADHKVTAAVIHPPEVMCPLDDNRDPVPVASCHPADYEGKPVVADASVQKIVDAALARSSTMRDEKLGVTLAAPAIKEYGSESELGDLFADLMLAAHPDAQLALTNGGGLRATLPAGELTYGQLFQSIPFDNRFALVDLLGKHVRTLVATNLKRGGGIFSWAGLTAVATCKGDKLDVQIKVAGKPLNDKAHYRLVTSDFLASGGDGALGSLDLPASATTMTETIIRDAMADVLRGRKGSIDPRDLLGDHKRLTFPGRRPVKCGGGGSGDGDRE